MKWSLHVGQTAKCYWDDFSCFSVWFSWFLCYMVVHNVVLGAIKWLWSCHCNLCMCPDSLTCGLSDSCWSLFGSCVAVSWGSVVPEEVVMLSLYFSQISCVPWWSSDGSSKCAGCDCDDFHCSWHGIVGSCVTFMVLQEVTSFFFQADKDVYWEGGSNRPWCTIKGPGRCCEGVIAAYSGDQIPWYLLWVIQNEVYLVLVLLLLHWSSRRFFGS